MKSGDQDVLSLFLNMLQNFVSILYNSQILCISYQSKSINRNILVLQTVPSLLSLITIKLLLGQGYLRKLIYFILIFTIRL